MSEETPDVFGEYFIEYVPDNVYVFLRDKWYATKHIGQVWPMTKAEAESLMTRDDFPPYNTKRENYRITKFQPSPMALVNCNPRHTV